MVTLRVAFFLILVVTVLVYLVHGLLWLPYPFQLNYGEGACVVYANQPRLGLSLYPPLDTPPYVANIYNPLYLWVVGHLMGSDPSLIEGRVISLMAHLAVLALIGFYAKRREGWLAGLFAAVFYLLNALPLHWSFIFRVDYAALAFTVAGLVCGVLAQGRWRWEILTAVLFSLSFYCKQSFLAAPAAVGLYLLLSAPRSALRFGTSYVVLVAVPFMLINRATDGQFFAHTVALNGKTAMLYSFDQLRDWGTAYLLSVAPLVALAGYFLARGGWRREPVLSLFWLFSIGISLGVGRIGGFYNYFLEFHVGLSLLAALGAAELGRKRPVLSLSAVLLGCWAGAVGFMPPFLFSPWQHLQHETLPVLGGRYPTYLARSYETAQLEPWIDHFGGPLLAENQANCTVLGEPPWLCDPSYFAVLIASGAWDEQKLIGPIKQKRFALILLQVTRGSPRFSRGTMDAILENYEEVGKAGVDRIFRPRPVR